MAFVLFLCKCKTGFQVKDRYEKLYSSYTPRVSSSFSLVYNQEVNLPEENAIVVTKLEKEETIPPTSAAVVVTTTESTTTVETVEERAETVETVETATESTTTVETATESPIQTEKVATEGEEESNLDSLERQDSNVNIAMARVRMPTYDNSLSWDHMSSLYA